MTFFFGVYMHVCTGARGYTGAGIRVCVRVRVRVRVRAMNVERLTLNIK